MKNGIPNRSRRGGRFSHLGDNVVASREERKETPSHGATACPAPGYNEDNEKDIEQASMMYCRATAKYNDNDDPQQQ